ncbi:STAS domain-containing protein [Tissierella sp. MSJ-40]|uniref:STAS domain-containing protein n=1 Tax=Tissierella simiarum TaxID=2841534 RepID=A0ABS6E4X0_9FIRM|nr:STAS domain-containing protein [Tissierella simiarum]MBU5437960.1 STAS domain-containing protein [Tissierella simiarum]
MSLNISINFNEEENLWVFSPEGEVDIYTSSKFKEEILRAFDTKKTDLLINGKKLDYVDSTGLGSLISILKTVKANNNKIYLEDIKPNIRKLFDITDLDKLFIIRGEGNE